LRSLLLILAANLYVRATGPVRLWPYYTLLVASLVANIVVPMSAFLALPGWEKVAASCAVVFAPIFFAGIVFSTSFRASRNPGVDFGSNVAGAVLGGLCENFSLVLGFNYLLVVAVAFYLISMALRRGTGFGPTGIAGRRLNGLMGTGGRAGHGACNCPRPSRSPRAHRQS